jgi:hypothetical protein
MYFANLGGWEFFDTWEDLVTGVAKSGLKDPEVMSGVQLFPEKLHALRLAVGARTESMDESHKLFEKAFSLLSKVQEWETALGIMRGAAEGRLTPDIERLSALTGEAKDTLSKTLRVLRVHESPDSKWKGDTEEEWQVRWCNNPRAFRR